MKMSNRIGSQSSSRYFGKQSSVLAKEQVETEFNLTRDKYRRGELPLAEYRSWLKTMILRDTQGRVWTIGAKTGRWYRREGKQWVADTPEDSLALYVFNKYGDARRPSASIAYCRRCGSVLRPQAKFCSQCGTPRR